MLFCGSIFETIVGDHVTDYHEFTLTKNDATPTRQKARFAKLAIPTRRGSPGRFRHRRQRLHRGDAGAGGDVRGVGDLHPGHTGARDAILGFDDTATGGPHLVGLGGSGATPTLIVNPAVGRAGSVTTVTGTKWPANQTMTLRWTDPVTGASTGFPEPSQQMTADGAGNLTTALVTFPNKTVGGRQLLGAVGAFTADAPFLVGPGSSQPGDFILRR